MILCPRALHALYRQALSESVEAKLGSFAVAVGDGGGTSVKLGDLDWSVSPMHCSFKPPGNGTLK